MNPPIHSAESVSNKQRTGVTDTEPRAQRTYTPSLAVLAHSAGIFHWTPEDRRLYDFTSGVLVANLGHNLTSWQRRFEAYMGWPAVKGDTPSGHFPALPLTAYNAVTPVEVEATRRLVELLQARPGGRRLEQVCWAASGSEAIQKALWASLARRGDRDLILATRGGFHGKKGLAGAVTGSEADRERDPRVRFISFPMAECRDVSLRDSSFDAAPYVRELEALVREHGRRIGTLITEPYLGGGGSYHPAAAYLQLLQAFCREHEILFVLDEVQSNFGRTGRMFAFESYDIEPDLVVLGKGLGNGVPVAAVAGPRAVFAALEYGEGSDTWSANPLACAGVLATLDEFADSDVLANCRSASPVIEEGLLRLKSLPFIAHVRGERNGMVWGVETCDHDGHPAANWANDFVLACYRGDGKNGIHLLGPLAKRVIRIAPPLTITVEQATAATDLMFRCLRNLVTESASSNVT
jgi:4-aminobutyrate aminotransferase-like enzyme